MAASPVSTSYLPISGFSPQNSHFYEAWPDFQSYFLRPLLPIANIDISRYILVYKYIHTRDKLVIVVGQREYHSCFANKLYTTGSMVN
jgi:hypothetical protein